MKSKSRIIVLIVIAILIIWTIYRVTTKLNPDNKTEVNTSITVVTKKVESGNITGKLNYTGNIEGIKEAVVISQTAGIIQKIFTEIGKPCKENEVLVQIENEQQKAGTEQAKAQVLLAETNYEKANKDLQRIEKLFSETVATKDNLELAQLNAKSALAQLKGAEAALKVSDKQLSDTYIKATIGGKVASKEVNLGGTVAPGTKIATIVDNSQVKVKVLVSENDIVKLKIGFPVSVTIDAIPDKVFIGKIRTIGLITEQAGRSYPVEIIIDNKSDGEIKSGMFARCEIAMDQKSNILLIPNNAIITNSDGSKQVYVYENGKAILKKIKTGITGDGKVEILEGLALDQKIVTEGKERIQEGINIQEK